MERLLRLSPIKISVIYGVLATAWILFSDSLLFRSQLSPASTLHLGMLKGTLFVVITMLALCCLMQTMARQIESHRAEHEAELRESEARFSTAFRSSPEGMSISVIDSGRYVEANSVFLSMLGYSRTELIGHSSLELSVWLDAADRAQLLKQLSDGPVNGYSTRFRSKEGRTLDMELSVDKIQLHGQSHLLLIARDVTKQLELERQFQQAQKLEAVAQVAAGVAHDFKNQLMVIGAYTDMLEVTGETNVIAKDKIKQAVAQSAALTKQLLVFSRRDDVTPQKLELNALLTKLWKMVPSLMGGSIASTLEVHPTLWDALLDRSQFEQIVMNLAVNARDAMPRGGAFALSATNLSIPAGSSTFDCVTVSHGDYVHLIFSDTGHGMSPDVVRRIFEPFFTTKEQGKGTGLGLAAVQSIVKQSNGYIFVESAPGRGTTFQILLPRHCNGSVSHKAEHKIHRASSRDA